MTEEKSIDELLAEHRPKRLTLTATALILSAAANLLFWEIDAGMSFFVYILGFLTIFTGVMWRFGHATQKSALWLLIPILVLSANVVRFETPLVAYATPILVWLLIIVYMLWLTLRTKDGQKFDFRNMRVNRNWLLPFSTMGIVFKDLKRESLLGDGKIRKRRLNHIILGFGIGIPLVLLFVLLFSAADPIFKQAVKDFWAALHIDWITFYRVVIVAIWMFVLAAVLYFVSSRKHDMLERTYSVKNWSTTVVNTVLALVNLIFLAFIYIQVKYLFLGTNALDILDLTYAEYAREGFFQLLMVIAIVGLFLIFLYGTIIRTRSSLLRILSMLLAGLSIVVCFSALKRMGLYEQEFGLTLMRLYTSWTIVFFAGLLAIGIVYITARLNFGRMFVSGLILGLLAFMIATSVNIEKMIVNTNIDHYKQTQGDLDTGYIATLGNDALPTIEKRFKELDEGTQGKLIEWMGIRLYSHNFDKKDWREFTFSTYFALQAENQYGLVKKATYNSPTKVHEREDAFLNQ